ncbi:MAG: hypothetical protein JW909_09355, partial [Planctomycetes bacterium]|nr:hypothetical protein [Planctomycetota bacterium]
MAAKSPRRKPTIIVTMRNHFDNTWRRCWDRPFEYGGRSFSSYIKVEKAVLDEQYRLALSSPLCGFEVESSRVLRRWLMDRPDRDEVTANLRKLLADGRFLLLGSGEVIPDANMPLGETLARNLAEGFWWARETLGEQPLVGWHCDGFGSNAQLPQIFRQAGILWIASLSYKRPSKEYWRGLDGTVAYLGRPAEDRVNNYHKYPPCPVCKGLLCTQCKGSGLDLSRRLSAERLPDMSGVDTAYLYFTGEEILPPPDLPDALGKHGRLYDVQGGTLMSHYARIAPLITPQKLRKPPLGKLSPEPDGNPTSSGCLVSRIELKRRHRFGELVLFAAEAFAAAAALDRDVFPYIPPDPPAAQKTAGPRVKQWVWAPYQQTSVPPVNMLWRDLAFGAFHDAITATHVDPAYRELMDMYDCLEDSSAAWLRGAAGAVRAGGETLRLMLPGSVSGPADVWLLDRLPESFELKAEGKTLRVTDDETTPEGARRVTVEGLEGLSPGVFDVAVKKSAPVQVKPGKARPRVKCGGFDVRVDSEGIVSVARRGLEVLKRRRDYPVGMFVEIDSGDPWATRDLHR